MTIVIGPPHSSGLDRSEALEIRRRQEFERARREGWPELHADDLVRRPFGILEHRPTDQRYCVHRGELVSVIYTSANAFYRTKDGGVVFLEPGPETRA